MEAGGGEFIAFLICAAISGWWIVRFVSRLLQTDSLACGVGPRIALAGMFFLCGATFLVAVRFVATAEVRESPFYIFLFLLSTIVAMAAFATGLGALGIDGFRNGIEQNNSAARILMLASFPAVTICSIGANIGEGDFVGSTFIPQALAVAILLGLCVGYATTTEAFTVIASDRDTPAAWRLASLLIAWALLLANSAHGDWVSFAETLKSFAFGTIASAGVLVVAIVHERRLQAAPAASLPRAVIVPAAINLGLATGLFFVLP